MEKNSLKMYAIIERFGFIKDFLIKGGIKVKWGVIISLLILLILVLLSSIYLIMSTNALLSANDRLCNTIADNIASTESIITGEKKTYKRSIILQEQLSRLSRNNIMGLVHAAIYDLKGMLTEKKLTYAAHTDTVLKGSPIPDKIIEEIREARQMSKRKVFLAVKKGGPELACYQYRIPFKFFNTRVGVIEIVFTEESILGPVNRAKLYIFLSAFGMLLFGIFISTVSAKGMVKPIMDLTRGVTRVSGGDLDVELEVNTHDEIGVLTSEFNVMINHLREKIQMQKFVSESTVSMIKQKAKAGDIGLGGSRENFAFLFSDVRGFTAMSEKLQPEEVVSILNQYLDLQAQIIKKNGGDIDKFVGDEVMAVFSGDNRADNAIKAAVEIVDALAKFNEERQQKGERVIQVGIGLNIGDVVHGRMGSRDRMDNTSIGDTVNLSARLCSQAEAGSILASKDIVARASKKKFIGKKLDAIRVKGKEKPIEIFQITGMK